MWTPIDIQANDVVMTPSGSGVVRALSSNGTAQVVVDGQLYDIPKELIRRVEEPIVDGVLKDYKSGNDKKEQEPVEFKKGDKVRHKLDGAEGKVQAVTKQTVKVKFGNNDDIISYSKPGVLDFIEKYDEESPQEETPQQKDKKKQVEETADSLYGILQLQQHLEKRIDNSVDEELRTLRELANKNRRLEVKVGNKVNEVKGLKHQQLETLITYAGLRLNSLLVGMAGTGKTFAGEQTAEALGINFYAVSVGAQTSKSDIIGYTDANGKYVRTHFRDAYEKGGLFLMDEIDAGNANVLIQVNAALSNGYMSFPDKMVRKHKDFVFVASANTYGNGANRQYVGRNQLDAATLDRFAVIDWLIDDELEENLAVGKYGKAWYMAVRATRDFVRDKNIRALISPRATQKGSQLLAAGIGVDEVISSVLLSSVPEDKKADVIQVATRVFNNHASDVPSEVVEDIIEVKESEIDLTKVPS